MRFLFLFAFHQLVDAWRKFVKSASKVIMLYDTIGIASYSRGVTAGSKRGAIPRAPNHYGSTESLRGAPNLFLGPAPSNLVTPLIYSKIYLLRNKARHVN